MEPEFASEDFLILLSWSVVVDISQVPVFDISTSDKYSERARSLDVKLLCYTLLLGPGEQDEVGRWMSVHSALTF